MTGEFPVKSANCTRSALFIGAMLTSQAFAGGIALIVHPDNQLKNVSNDEIKRLFLSKTDVIQGVKLKPIIQSSSQSIRIVFDEDTLGKSPSKSKAYWSRLIFTAAGAPPPSMESSKEIIKWVSTHPDAISYIEAGSVTGEIKLLKELQ